MFVLSRSLPQYAIAVHALGGNVEKVSFAGYQSHIDPENAPPTPPHRIGSMSSAKSKARFELRDSLLNDPLLFLGEVVLGILIGYRIQTLSPFFWDRGSHGCCILFPPLKRGAAQVLIRID